MKAEIVEYLRVLSPGTRNMDQSPKQFNENKSYIDGEWIEPSSLECPSKEIVFFKRFFINKIGIN